MNDMNFSGSERVGAHRVDLGLDLGALEVEARVLRLATVDLLEPYVIPAIKAVGNVAIFVGGIGELGARVLSTGRGKATLALLTLATLLAACGAKIPTEASPTFDPKLPTPSEIFTPTEVAVVASPTSITSTETPFVPYAAGGEIDETLIASERIQALKGVYEAWGNKLREDKIIGLDTTFSYVPLMDQKYPEDMSKAFLAVVMNAPGDTTGDGFFFLPPAGMMNNYLQGNAELGIAPGDIDQLMPPTDGTKLELLKVSRVVTEGSEPAKAGIPIGSVFQLFDQSTVYMYGSIGNMEVVGHIDENFQWVKEEEIIQYPVVEKAEDFRSCFIPAEALFDGKDGEVSSVVRYLKSISTEMTYDLSKLKFVDLERSLIHGGVLLYTKDTNPDYVDPTTRPYDRKYFCYTTDATGMDHFVSFVQYYVEGEKPENYPWVVITSPIAIPANEQKKVDLYMNSMSFPVILTTRDSSNTALDGDNPLTSLTFAKYAEDIQGRFDRFANGDPTALDGLVLETLTVSDSAGWYK